MTEPRSPEPADPAGPASTVPGPAGLDAVPPGPAARPVPVIPRQPAPGFAPGWGEGSGTDDHRQSAPAPGTDPGPEGAGGRDAARGTGSVTWGLEPAAGVSPRTAQRPGTGDGTTNGGAADFTPPPPNNAPSDPAAPGAGRRKGARPGPRTVAATALAGVVLGAVGCLLPWTGGPDAHRLPVGAHPSVGVTGLGTTLGWLGGDARISLALLLLALPAVLSWYAGWCGDRQRITGAAAGLAALLWTVTALATDPSSATWEGVPLNVSAGPGGFVTAAGAAVVLLSALAARRDPLSDFLASARRVHTLWLRGDRTEAVRRSQTLLRRGDRTLGDRDPDVRNHWFVHALMLAELGHGPQAVRAAVVAAARWVDRDRAREDAAGRGAGTPGALPAPSRLVALHRGSGAYATWAVLLTTDAVPVLLGEAARVLVAEPGPMALLQEALPEIRDALAAEASAHLPAPPEPQGGTR